MERAQALAIILCCGLALGCVYPPSTTATPRSPTYVAASFAKNWDAVIDAFAERNIPLRTLDRSSGFAATDELGADGSARWADCGSDAIHGDVGPRHAIWNVRLKGDSTAALILVTARWWMFRGKGTNVSRVDCVTTGAWEREAEEAIRDRAEHS